MFLDVTWLEKPKVFVSSTMDKDTLSIRKSLMEKLENLGYEVIAFESNEFPYSNDNSSDITQDTINAVAKSNLFILILDENFGSFVDGKSVIQREYLRARELRIPTFVFVQKDVWKNYTEKMIGDSSYIKSQEHYDFIRDVAQYKISSYTIATDCIEHLHKQLLNFLGGCLKFSSKASWLWNENYTRSIESNANEVWIITPDFMWDFNDEHFRNIVINNVTQRGCVYKYIFLASQENIQKKDEMFRYYAQLFIQHGKSLDELNKQVQYLAIKPEKFYWSCEQILYNPFSLDERAIIVDVMDVRDRTLKFNTEYGFGKRLVFRQQFMNYWNSSIKSKDAKINESDYSQSDGH